MIRQVAGVRCGKSENALPTSDWSAVVKMDSSDNLTQNRNNELSFKRSMNLKQVLDIGGSGLASTRKKAFTKLWHTITRANERSNKAVIALCHVSGESTGTVLDVLVRICQNNFEVISAAGSNLEVWERDKLCFSVLRRNMTLILSSYNEWVLSDWKPYSRFSRLN